MATKNAKMLQKKNRLYNKTLHIESPKFTPSPENCIQSVVVVFVTVENYLVHVERNMGIICTILSCKAFYILEMHCKASFILQKGRAVPTILNLFSKVLNLPGKKRDMLDGHNGRTNERTHG